MRKDVLLTVGGVAAMGAIVFGVGAIALSYLVPPPEQAKPFELPHEAQERKARLGEAQKHDQIDELKARFEDQYSRGVYDDARITASKAMALAGRTSPEWVRRLADATFMSEALPQQQRYAKAYEGYSKLLTDPPADRPEEMEWARYRAAQCLLHMRQWEEAMQAMENYLRDFSTGVHLNEVRLMYAQSLLALGRISQAKEELLKIPPKAPEAAKALLELARIDTERLKRDVNDGPVDIAPNKEKTALPESATPPPTKPDKDKSAAPPVPAPAYVETEPTAPAVKPASSPESVAGKEPVDDLPDAQWESIRSAAKNGKYNEAQRLLQPWLASDSALTNEARARVTLKYAKMLRELYRVPEQSAQ